MRSMARGIYRISHGVSRLNDAQSMEILLSFTGDAERMISDPPAN